MDHILDAIKFVAGNAESFGEMFSAVAAAFVSLVGAIWTLFTFLAKGWDTVFGTSRGDNLTSKIGAFLRRFSLLKDDPKV